VFLGLGDDSWLVKEAKLHRVNGAIQMVGRNCKAYMRAPLTRIIFENAGIPTLSIPCDNVDARQWDEPMIRSLVSTFIEERLIP
jgi:hypothetical protein